MGSGLPWRILGVCQKIGSHPDFVCCTANYRPPELWTGRRPYTESGGLLPSIDMWSFGCSQWEMVMGNCRLFFPGERMALQQSIEVFALQHRKNTFEVWKTAFTLPAIGAISWRVALNLWPGFDPPHASF